MVFVEWKVVSERHSYVIFAERKITNDEKLLQVRDEWLKRGRIPYFFLREQSTSLLVKGKPQSPYFLSFSFLFFLSYPLPPSVLMIYY